MAPKAKKSRAPTSDPNGMFAGMVVFLVEYGVQTRRLEIWKQKLVQMGATIADRLSKRVSHVFAVNRDALLRQVDREHLERFQGNVLQYQWLEDSLRLGEKISGDSYNLKFDSEVQDGPGNTSEIFPQPSQLNNSREDGAPQNKRMKSSPEKNMNEESRENKRNSTEHETSDTVQGSDESFRTPSPENSGSNTLGDPNKAVGKLDSSLPYSPPDLNKNITEIFGKLINIYRALGDDRRSFSYHKAIGVIEKLPFKIESADQVKDLPTIGKSMQDHVRTINLFGEVWGIGPATALKLYEKGYRTLDDLKNEDSLTNAQKLGLKYFDDIKKRVPRHEVQEMELLLQKAGEEVLPGVSIVCGGSYRRGKASCGDLDIIITHPDGKSHRGFLPRYLKHLKDMKFLREDLIFSTHSEEGTDSGVDTYFGLCTYPARELRHRIDLKVYPRNIYAFGLIAWTGNDVLNRRLRILAESKGYRLDDTGLFLAAQGSGGKRGSRATTSLSFRMEQEVFEFLGFPWLEPHERNL